ncbi:uncharacterized protein TNCV_3413341 [Trichonephila clavipes]|uniref:Uncharacterized protein n=1 Tax=Trichonephila clavipes TaxID=2585209 RepID=A0A8X6RRS1_TRICX|nr:uncharacterized protein TNCV_3413341 [Trichonephila clavipes]
MTPELAPPLLTPTPHQREDVSALDRFNVHRCPTRRVFSGTGLELVTRQATIRYLYHSATRPHWRRGLTGYFPTNNVSEGNSFSGPFTDEIFPLIGSEKAEVLAVNTKWVNQSLMWQFLVACSFPHFKHLGFMKQFTAVWKKVVRVEALGNLEKFLCALLS